MKYPDLDDEVWLREQESYKLSLQIAEIEGVMDYMGKKAVELMEKRKSLLEQLKMINTPEPTEDPYADA